MTPANTIPPLEERLKGVNKDSLTKALLASLVVPTIHNTGYLKLDITYNLEECLKEKGVFLTERDVASVDQNIYSAILKEPLKQVQYGMINSGRISDDIFKSLTYWESAYFLAGVWAKKAVPNRRLTPVEDLKYDPQQLSKQPVELIVAESIVAGMNRIRQIHEKERYKTKLKLPFCKELKEDYERIKVNYETSKAAPDKVYEQTKLF